MRHSINSTHTIKAANSAVVLDIIRKSNSVTIEDIVTAAHLSRPTVLGIIEEQVKSGIIERIGFAETSIGRQPTLYSLTTSNYFSIGIDFEFPHSA